MCTYTKEQIVMIDEATMEAKDRLAMAYQLFSNFDNEYLLDSTMLENLIFDATHYPDKVRLTLSAIRHLLYEAVAELAVFGDVDAPELQGMLDCAAEKQNIIKTYREEG